MSVDAKFKHDHGREKDILFELEAPIGATALRRNLANGRASGSKRVDQPVQREKQPVGGTRTVYTKPLHLRYDYSNEALLVPPSPPSSQRLSNVAWGKQRAPDSPSNSEADDEPVLHVERSFTRDPSEPLARHSRIVREESFSRDESSPPPAPFPDVEPDSPVQELSFALPATQLVHEDEAGVGNNAGELGGTTMIDEWDYPLPVTFSESQRNGLDGLKRTTSELLSPSVYRRGSTSQDSLADTALSPSLQPSNSPYSLHSNSATSNTTLAPFSSSACLLGVTSPLPPAVLPAVADSSAFLSAPSHSAAFLSVSTTSVSASSLLLGKKPTFSALPDPEPLPFGEDPTLALSLPLFQQPPSQPTQPSQPSQASQASVSAPALSTFLPPPGSSQPPQSPSLAALPLAYSQSSNASASLSTHLGLSTSSAVHPSKRRRLDLNGRSGRVIRPDPEDSSQGTCGSRGCSADRGTEGEKQNKLGEASSHGREEGEEHEAEEDDGALPLPSSPAPSSSSSAHSSHDPFPPPGQPSLDPHPHHHYPYPPSSSACSSSACQLSQDTVPETVVDSAPASQEQGEQLARQEKADRAGEGREGNGQGGGTQSTEEGSQVEFASMSQLSEAFGT
ncbi:hypothetical protein JCM8547_001737 [Rhodosporidiobolus lusitaniae]